MGIVSPARRALGVAVLVLAASLATASASTQPALRFRVFAHGLPKLNGIVWTGRRFLYVENTANTVWSAPSAGLPIRRFATMPRISEETRCVRSTGGHGFPTGDIFCHSPDHKIYEFSPDGKIRKTFATLPTPYPPAGDGALAFDTVGHFGYRLLAATGRSGAGIHPPGGALYAIGRSGKVEEVATYSGPGGADEVLVAPLSFGSAAGDALLTVDAATDGGSLVAIDPSGQQRAIATFPDGPNPIVALSRPSAGRPGRPLPGLYLTDDTSSNVYYAPAASLAAFAGDVLIGTESHARFWIVAPQGDGFATIPVRTNLGLPTYSLEQMIAVR